MSSPNPYLNPSADDDLFSDDTKTEESGEKAPDNEIKAEFITGRTHADHIPDEIKAELKKHVHIDLDEQGRSTMPPELRMVSTMMEFYSSITNFKDDGALIAAMAQMLDEWSNGSLRDYHMKYESEREIIASKILLNFSNAFVKLLRLDEETTKWTAEVVDYIESYCEMVQFNFDKAVHNYRKACEMLEEEPDEGLIENGVYSVRTFITRIALAMPPGESDVD